MHFQSVVPRLFYRLKTFNYLLEDLFSRNLQSNSPSIDQRESAHGLNLSNFRSATFFDFPCFLIVSQNLIVGSILTILTLNNYNITQRNPLM